MTIPACSIEKSATLLVDMFGDRAPACARERMEEYRPGDDKDGYRFWLAVAFAATGLLDRERAGSARQSARENTGAAVAHPVRP